MKQKTLKKILLGLLAIGTFSSCLKDESKITYQAFGIAHPVVGENYNYKIVTDDGEILIPAGTSYNIKDSCRVYSTFTFVNEDDYKLDSAEVDFIYIEDILYKPITNRDTSLGNSPIYVRKNKIWQSKYHRILNIPFEFDGGKEKHLISLYYNETKSNQDTVLLEFRHNANADPYNQRISGLVSFDLNCIEDFATVNDSIFYTVTINRGTSNLFINEWTGVYKKQE